MADSDSADKKLSARQLAFVAAYLGDARFNATKAAITAGYSEKTAAANGFALLRNVGIRDVIKAWRDEASSEAIASVRYRVERLAGLERGYFDVIEARKEAYGDDRKVIGGDTGLVVIQTKIASTGETVDEYVADTAVTKEIRAIYDDVAKEMGQRVEKSETKLDATSAFIASLRAFSDPGHA